MKLRLDEKTSDPFAADVRRGLGGRPKVLPPKYFYDALGSQLFEAICQLPWYPITRAETALLARSAREMVEPFGGGLFDLVELGSGCGEKVAVLARALQGREEPLGIHLVDISAKALELSRSTLSRLEHVIVAGHCAPYEAGLRALAAERRSGGGARLVLFLGSNIGNFDPGAAAALLGEIRAALRPGDGLLLGADLVRSEAELLLAYDDPLGVTAAFNKNLLLRINTELGGDFDLGAFDHRAAWDARASRVEMHLVSRRPQAARIEAAGITASFEEGETIWTESSYKYTPESIAALGRRAGLGRKRQWIEEEGRFSITLFVVEKG
jgi:dimethylhistidine N-methyltransferase